MASTVEIKNNSFMSDGYFKACLTTNKENVATAAQLLNLEIEAFKISNISQYKLQEAKDAIYTEFALGMTDSLSLANIYSRDEILGLGFDYYTKFERNLYSVTIKEVLDAAKEYMLPDKKFLLGVSSSNISDLIYEDKKLLFKTQKDINPANNTKTSKDSKDSPKDSNNKNQKETTTSNNTNNTNDNKNNNVEKKQN